MSVKTAKTALPPEIAALSFEEAMGQLEGIVRQLESGQGKLDDAITAYERGAHLRAHCEAKLNEAQARIEKITPQPDGSLTTSPLE